MLTLLAFLYPEVVEVLVERFGINIISMIEEDMKVLFADGKTNCCRLFLI
ncbi:unknown [Tannerella sp. CAG:118]|uniref:Uncharacterized protein n=1 Tax=Coprobacter secundus subsp. similis TaxID=2751153 RepID=A0A7G1HU07_9BACT|nr:hypothetical protein Cop2CBH44_14990 [Coprobacter secundus subsp. similis]CCY37455.1 unknown [Tannerella sp. CAG:118]